MDNEQLNKTDKAEIIKQNKFLAGKVKGYELLAQLFQDSKHKVRSQEKQIEDLKKAVEELSGGVLTGSVITSAIDNVRPSASADNRGTEARRISTDFPDVSNSHGPQHSEGANEGGRSSGGGAGTTTENTANLSLQLLLPGSPSRGGEEGNPADYNKAPNTADHKHEASEKHPASIGQQSTTSPGSAARGSSSSSFTFISSSDRSSRKISDVDQYSDHRYSAKPLADANAQPASNHEQDANQTKGELQECRGNTTTTTTSTTLPLDSTNQQYKDNTYVTRKQEGSNKNDSRGRDEDVKDDDEEAALYSGSLTTPSLRSFDMKPKEKVSSQDLPDIASLDHESAAMLEAAGTTAASLKDSDLAVEITRNATKVMKMERNNALLKTLIDSLNRENDQLKADARNKDERIEKLDKEKCIDFERKGMKVSHQKIRRLEEEVQRASPTPSLHSEAPSSFGSGREEEGGATSTREKLVVKSMSESEHQEWIGVQRQQDVRQKQSSNTHELLLKDKEIEALKHAVAKKDRRLEKLQQANSAWDKHSRHTEKEYKQSMAQAQLTAESLQEKLHEQNRHFEQKVGEQRQTYEQQYQELVEHCNQMRVSRDRIQNENVDARQRIALIEAQYAACRDAQEADRARADAVETRARELQRKVQDMQDVIDALNSEARSMRFESIPPSLSQKRAGAQGMSREEMMTQIELLQTQVEICTEDFRKEREDRARAQSEKDDLSSRVHQQTEEIQDLSESLRRLQSEMDHMTRDKENAERMLAQKTEEFNTLERQIHHMRPPPTAPPPGYQDAPPSYHLTYHSPNLGDRDQRIFTPPTTTTTATTAGVTTAAIVTPPLPALSRAVERARLQGTTAAGAVTQVVGPAASPRHANNLGNYTPVTPPTWACPACTYENVISSERCEICHYEQRTESALAAFNAHVQHNVQRSTRPQGYEVCDGSPNAQQ